MAPVVEPETVAECASGGRSGNAGTCPYRKSNPEVLMMKPAENRPRQNHASSLHCTWNRRILAQRQVRAQCVAIVQVGQKNVTKVLLPEHDNMVSALPSNRSDQPFRIGILPCRSRSCRSISDAHRANTPGECFAVGLISIPQDV